ncbi:hypothetical protein T4A_5744 [Trichinella pseudospiralis]|uniref:Uncharacterized protein n=1 Tax=Trichinella pseudospiralis TaxID=6337 RepID=A0A0V1AJF8_TRIPS|nr:hypothetical protein T4A_5744 [Trichinella pseudospiralis]
MQITIAITRCKMFSEFNTALNCGYRPFTIAEQ